jgi:hypothetical protein
MAATSVKELDAKFDEFQAQLQPMLNFFNQHNAASGAAEALKNNAPGNAPPPGIGDVVSNFAQNNPPPAPGTAQPPSGLDPAKMKEFMGFQAQIQEMHQQQLANQYGQRITELEMQRELRALEQSIGRAPAVAELVGTKDGFSISLDIGRVALYTGVAVAIAVTAYGLILLVKEGVAWVAKQWV